MPQTKGAKGTAVTVKIAKKAMRTTIEGRRRLSLANMGIVVFPKCIFKIGNIDELDLSRNYIEKIPNDIGDLKSLKVLDLHSNRLVNIPETMGNLDNLENLNLSNNRISTLPSTLGSLINLKVFNIGINKVEHLPTSMEKLENLEELGLFDNQFKTLHEFVNDLPNLKKLNISRNPVWYSQRDTMIKPEKNNVYLVHENNLCKTCLTKCQHQPKPLRGTQGGGHETTAKEEQGALKDKWPRTSEMLSTPNSVAKINQDWRIRKNL